MNKITKNRLIGGAVILFAALFFIPSILKPTNQAIETPDLTISGSGTSETEQSSTLETKVDEKIGDENTTLVLASVDDEVVGDEAAEAKQPLVQDNKQSPENGKKTTDTSKNGADHSSQPMPFQLESIGGIDEAKGEKEQAVAHKIKEKVKEKTKGEERWVRIGSFSDLANADKLAKTLKTKNFPVHVETVKVSGKRYKRVLVGPFYNEKVMRAVLKQMRAAGFTPDIQ
ncbi:MAG: hypothetical protein CSA45_02670 [Gammaproteobacteria bacterium]|nr:MAG: hypothetical protein CSA45_02670 [Gammaproteobacteria bacterium]